MSTLHPDTHRVVLTDRGLSYAEAFARTPFPCPAGVEPSDWRKGLSALARKHLDLANTIIEALDGIDPDPEAEPSLGAPETRVPRGGFAVVATDCDQSAWADGGGDDDEDTNEDGGDILDEPHGDLREDDEDGGDAEQDYRNAPTTLPQRVFSIHPDNLPPVYVVTLEGACMQPEIMDGGKWQFSRDEKPAPGDVVMVFLRPGAYEAGSHSARVKRLIHDGRNASGEGYVLLEMNNPPQRLIWSGASILAIHKGLQPADDIPTWRCSEAEALAMSVAEGRPVLALA